MPDWNPENWQSVGREEYPPIALLVWTSDRVVVRLGQWQWQPPAPLAEGAWTDDFGNAIAVTHWCPREDSEGPPPVPPLASGPEHAIIGFRTRPPAPE